MSHEYCPVIYNGRNCLSDWGIFEVSRERHPDRSRFGSHPADCILATNCVVGGYIVQSRDRKTARPIGFYSRQYHPAEINYPTHEQEMLDIIACMKTLVSTTQGNTFYSTIRPCLESLQNTESYIISAINNRGIYTL